MPFEIQQYIKSVFKEKKPIVLNKKDKILKELFDYLKIPSISILQSAGYDSQEFEEGVCKFLKNKLDSIGFKTRIITEQYYDPVIYSQYKRDKNKFNLLVYCHTDVQPVEPRSEWKTDPFSPKIRDGKIYARGVSDSKGQLFSFITAVEQVISEQKELPINITFVIDCDEEAEQKSLPRLIKKHPELFKCDAILISAGSMVKNDTPSICCGYRGLISVEIELTTLKQNLHSGSFGGGALNAAECLTKLLSKIKDENNKIKIKGFYDNVKETTGTAGVWYKIKDFLKLIGAKEVACEKDYSLNQCLCLRPTFEINGIHAGSSENSFQYIVPSTAKAKVSFRLVCNQDPDDVFKKFKDFIGKNKQKGTRVKVKLVDKAYPTTVSEDTDFIRIIEKSFDNLFKNNIVKYYEGGCVPIIYDFLRFTKQIYMVGFGSPDDNIHGPNEKLNVKDFFKGIKFYKNLIENLEQ